MNLLSVWSKLLAAARAGAADGGSGTARTVLFFHDYRQFSGGHLKLWHYFNHVKATAGYRPVIFFSPASVWDENNPWLPVRQEVLQSCSSLRPDVLFVDGLDWALIDALGFDYKGIPVINFVQGVRHSQPQRPHYQFLQRRALRICVSDEVAEAIGGTGLVNGPVVVIKNGLDALPLHELGASVAKTVDLLIVALKQPEMGGVLRDRLQGSASRVTLLDARMSREQFLRQLAQAHTAVFLPHKEEGFYLPALEAMAMGTVVVCPDCVGNRSFCRPGFNCFRPTYSVDDIVAQVDAALGAGQAERERLLENARQTLADHTLEREREAFQRTLTTLDEVWQA